MGNNTTNNSTNNTTNNTTNNSANNSANNTITTTSLKTELDSLTSRVLTLETSLTGVQNEVTSLKVADEVEGDEESFSWNPLDWFGLGGDTSEGFSNEDNNLFFMIAIIVILYYCLKR